MSTLYRPTPVTSAEQAEALPEGTVVTGTAAGVVEKGGRGRWWAGLHQVDARAVVGGTALLPIEVEEAEAAVARVRDLHRDDGTGDCTECAGINGMGEFWPCPTILALNGEE